MKKLVFVLGMIGFAWACTSVNNGEVEAVDGQKVYKTFCVTCHGIQGNMGVAGAFDLTTSSLILEERILVISKGRNTMTPFESVLSPEKIKAVAEYTMQLKVEE